LLRRQLVHFEPINDEAIIEIINIINTRVSRNSDASNPVNGCENLNRLSEEHNGKFVNELGKLARIASRAGEAKSELEAADIWQEAFGYMFPMPDISEEIVKIAADRGVPAIILPNILVIAKPKGSKEAREFTGVNKIGPIPKKCDITFEVTNFSKLPAGAEVFWVVRNEGREAELTNDLGHSHQRGRIAYETSAYKGTHYMDCTVKLAGRTIAIRRVPVVIMGMELPLRNPLKKPNWVRLR
jgi:hypothetical protein